MASAAKDLTEGRPSALILRFALPMMLGSACQQLYTLTDAAIVGQAVGVRALAAVGAADWFNWLVLGVVMGFSQGFAILPAQRFGAGDMERLRKSAAAGLTLTAALAVLLTAVSLPAVTPVLRLMHTEAAIFDDARVYLLILFAGIPIVAGYNTAGSLLRSLGDSRNPLVAMAIGAGSNIVLDLLFVVGFRWGVAGAAGATLIGQGCAFLYSLAVLLRTPAMRLCPSDWRPDRQLLRREFLLGLPMALQNGVIGIGGMAVQQVVNGFGYVFVAGFTATNKLYGLLELAAINFGYAVASFTGQNLGAGKYRRIRSGVKDAARLGVLTSLAVTAVMLTAGRWLVSLFLSAEDPSLAAEAQAAAFRYLVTMCVPLSVLYLLYIYRSALQGMGDTVTPFVSGILELVMRLGTVHIAPALLDEWGVYIAEPLAWLGADLILLPAFFFHMGRLQHISSQTGDDSNGTDGTI